MMRSNDPLKFLAPDPAAGARGVQWRKGVIVTWDPDTAENTVLINGALVENVPILNTSEAMILAQGDVVGLLSFGSTWGILGRFTIPGTPGAGSALTALRTYSDSVNAGETTVSSSFVNLTTPGPAVTARIGASGRALVIVSCVVEGTAPRGVTIQYGGSEMTYEMTGANSLTATANSNNSARVQIGYESASTFGADLVTLVGTSRVSLQENLNPGDTVFTAKYRKNVGTIARFSGRNLTVMAL